MQERGTFKMSLLNRSITPTNSFYQITEPFTPDDYVSEAVGEKKMMNIQEREHTDLFGDMQKMKNNINFKNSHLSN